MRNLSLLTVLIVLCVFTPAQSARFSGDYLLQMCGYDEAGKEIVEGGHIACQAYIAGILDYHALIRSMGTAPSVDFCVPENVTMNEVHQKITSYVFRNKHEQGPFIAAPGVALGLFQAYPCKK